MEDEDVKPLVCRDKTFSAEKEVVKLEGEDIKPLMSQDKTSGDDHPNNQIPSLASTKSPNFELELQNLAENTNRLKKELNDLSSREFLSATSQNNDHKSTMPLTFPYDVDRDPLKSVDQDSLQGGMDCDNNKKSVKQNNKGITHATTGSARKRKSSKPINYFEYLERQNYESERLHPVEDDTSSEQETLNDEVNSDNDQETNEAFEPSVKTVGINYKKSINNLKGDELKNATMSSPEDKPFTCAQCGEIFTIYRELSKHMRMHTQQQLYICSICDENFFFSQSLEMHMKNHMEKDTSPKPRYPCSYCSFTFVSPSSLKTHVRTHTGEKPFQCSVCQMTFSLSNNLLTHMRKHTGERPYKCSVCGRGFCKSSDVTRHMKTHSLDRPHWCFVCKKGFKDPEKLKSHMRVHSVRPHKCDYCDESFMERKTKNRHIRTVHGKDAFAQMKKDIDELNKDNKEETEPQSSSEDSYLNHDDLPSQSFVSDDDKVAEQIKNFAENCQETEQKWDFDTPKDSLWIDGNLSEAVVGENGSLEFDSTSKAWTTDERKRSKCGASKKKPEKPKSEMFKCTECNKEFRSTSALTIHVRTHTGERPFECSMCDWTFSILGNLKAHMKTHSGEKPYRCEVCDKAFTKKCDVKRHLITHTGERNHMCVTCGKTFSQKCVLQTHMLLHSGEKPFKCSECDKAFCQRVQLITHMKMHKGDRPYRCTICDKRFREKSTYETHGRIHTGEMPFQCTLCGKFFRDKSYLRKHNKKHHENREPIPMLYFPNHIESEQQSANMQNTPLGLGTSLQLQGVWEGLS